jgi:hypothetical protein
MRVRWILTLALLGMTVVAAAQKNQHQTAKSSKSSRDANSKSSAALKQGKPHDSSSLELRKIEQETARTNGGKNNSGRKHTAAVVKTQRQKGNPPIHFSSASDGRGSGKGSSSKSRVRRKGGGRH